MKEFRALADNQSNAAVLAERARFMQAESRYMRGQYPEACDTYHKVLLDFPTGAYRRDCCARMFQICDYWLDDFRDDLDKRSGEKGVLRWKPHWPDFKDPTKPKVDQEGRTLEALTRVHTHDITGPTADKAIFWCGYVNFIRGNFGGADNFFSQLVEFHTDSPLRPQAMAFAIQAKNNATGGAAHDGRKCAEAATGSRRRGHRAGTDQQPGDGREADGAVRDPLAAGGEGLPDGRYYERDRHPGSAVFYYELVRRRYAGHVLGLATERQARL